MADKTKSEAFKAAEAEAAEQDEAARDELAEAQEKGYIGSVPDERPNSDYTVAGVTKSDDK